MREGLFPQGWSWEVTAEECSLGEMHEGGQQICDQAIISVFQQVKWVGKWDRNESSHIWIIKELQEGILKWQGCKILIRISD